LKLISL
jgi:voltage-gated sodium channel